MSESDQWLNVNCMSGCCLLSKGISYRFLMSHLWLEADWWFFKSFWTIQLDYRIKYYQLSFNVPRSALICWRKQHHEMMRGLEECVCVCVFQFLNCKVGFSNTNNSCFVTWWWCVLICCFIPSWFTGGPVIPQVNSQVRLVIFTQLILKVTIRKCWKWWRWIMRLTETDSQFNEYAL